MEQTYHFLSVLAKMDYVSEQDVKWAFGVLQTNSIGLPTGRALYPIVSVMNHSCAPNMTALTIPGEAIAFKANQDMQTDDEFTIRHQLQSISWKIRFRVCSQNIFVQKRHSLKKKRFQTATFNCK